MNISKNETIMQRFVFDEVDCYVVTRNLIGKYTLYKIINDDYQKMKVSETPLEFDELVKKDRSR